MSVAIVTIRIGAADGKVIERDVEVEGIAARGGPDRIKWVIDPISGGPPTTVFKVVFGSAFDPFSAGKVIDVKSNAGGSNPETVQGLPKMNLQVQRPSRV